MSDLSSSSTETIALLNRQMRRLRRLTIISLCLNGLILFLIFVGSHHDKHQNKDGDNDGGRDEKRGHGGHCHGGGRHHFHHGGMDRGWGRQGGFDQDRGQDFGDNGGFRGREGDGNNFDNHPFGGGMGGGFGHGGMGGGFGRHGMMGGSMGTPPDPAKMTDGVLNMLTDKLTLTDDEKAKIKPIIEAQVAQMQKDMEAQHAAMQKQIEDTKAKIKPMLTADQQKALDALPVPGQKPSPSETPPATPGQ